MKLIILKKISSLANMKSFLDTHLRVVHEVLIASEDVKLLGPLFSQLRVILVASFWPASNEGYLEEVELWV